MQRGNIVLVGHPSTHSVLADIAKRAGYDGAPGSIAQVPKGQKALLGVNDSISLRLAQMVIPGWPAESELIVAVLNNEFCVPLRQTEKFKIPNHVRVIAGDPEIDKEWLAWMIIPPEERAAA